MNYTNDKYRYLISGRCPIRITICALLFCLFVGPLAAQSADDPPFSAEHPADAALFQEADGTWVFMDFPSGSRLFVYDEDAPGKSACTGGCASAWPPLVVSDDSLKPVGNWTVIVRDDGNKQWAYKDQPVYRRFHDLPGEVQADGFHLLRP